MKRLLASVALAVAFAAPVHAQVIYDNQSGINGATSRSGDNGVAQQFTITLSQTLSQFGFYSTSTNGGVFKFFVANAANTILYSGEKTFGATSGLLMSDVFSLALVAGQSYSLGMLARDGATNYNVSYLFPAVPAMQNGITPVVGNENWHNFDNPTEGGGGSVTFAMQLRGPGVTATPEPASIALMATGLVAVAGVAKRRRNRAA
jgi:hypothetical protein